jgi:hypothetical protein
VGGTNGVVSTNGERSGWHKWHLVVKRINANCGLVKNESQVQEAYLSVRLVGTQSNRDAIGTVLTLKVGERSWIRQIAGGGSYASTNDLSVHFGIPAKVAAAWK